MQQHHALDLPEIVTRIGQFLPLWTGHGLSRVFSPKPLLNCALVSKLFRSQLTPTLWYLYDGFRMRSIPATILVKYSPLFRIITSTGPFKGPFKCRNLIELWTVYGQEWSRDLLVSNPGLKRLVWGGPFHRRIETLEQQQEWELELKALMGLAHLDEFRTSGFSLGEGIFVKVLRNNASRLMNLQMMSKVAGVTSIEGLELPFLTELQVAFGEEESPAMVDLVRCCPRLQRLSLTGSKTRRTNATATMLNLLENAVGDFNNNGVVTMIESSYGHSSNSIVDPEITRLAENLTECCPELCSIKITSNFSNILKSECFLNGAEAAVLVLCCGRLESFSADMVSLIDYSHQEQEFNGNYNDNNNSELGTFNHHFQSSYPSRSAGSPLTDALIGKGEFSMRSLCLSFHETEVESQVDRVLEMKSIQKLKTSLRGLKDLHLSWDATLAVTVNQQPTAAAAVAAAPVNAAVPLPEGIWMNDGDEEEEDDEAMSRIDAREAAVDEFLKQPWGSSHLESLTLHGIYTSDLHFTTTNADQGTIVISPSSPSSSSSSAKPLLGSDSVVTGSIWRPAATTSETRDWRDRVEQRQQALYQQRTAGVETQNTQRLLVSLQHLRHLKYLCLNHVPYERNIQ
ncbi:hypothetical protein BGZ83_008463 [Gryganskiella cystojenkinii]|nr:hypothetical protein BGZ83_008463 [Gryganskiella cystojenkinii]